MEEGVGKRKTAKFTTRVRTKRACEPSSERNGGTWRRPHPFVRKLEWRESSPLPPLGPSRVPAVLRCPTSYERTHLYKRARPAPHVVADAGGRDTRSAAAAQGPVAYSTGEWTCMAMGPWGSPRHANPELLFHYISLSSLCFIEKTLPLSMICSYDLTRLHCRPFGVAVYISNWQAKPFMEEK